MSKIAEDPRIDPRIKAVMGAMPSGPQPDIASREDLLAEVNTPAALAAQKVLAGFMDMLDNEDVAPSAGLELATHEFSSAPDGNTIKVQFIRPQSDEPLPCVYYIHGGGMQAMSCFDGMYRGWGRMIAGQGVAVAMVDFRNCLTPSSAPEVEPFPAGLNDCVSGLKWLREKASDLGIDPAHIIVAGESGGGNLTLATGMKLKQDGDLGLVRGLYALCPYIAGIWPQDRLPSTTENEGILLHLHNNRGAMAYGIAVFPILRELMIMLVLWYLLIRPGLSAARVVVLAGLLLGGLMALRAGGGDYRHPVLWLQWLGIAGWLGALIAWVIPVKNPPPDCA